jgi:hypothetical protein
MPADLTTASVAAASLPRSKPTTRSSIRHSLTLANVGKALADVMHKENKEATPEKERGSRRTRESTRRANAVTGDDKPMTLSKRDRDVTSDVKTITRSRKLSALQPPQARSSGLASSDELSSSSPAGNSPKRLLTRSSSLRPRPRPPGSSALPKYRPRSVVIEPGNVKTPPSPPIRAGIRRRLSSSEDEKEVGKPLLTLEVPHTSQKSARAISPLPHRGALQVNLTGAINVRPTTPEKKTKPSTPTPNTTPSRRHSSPTRLPTSRQKAAKLTKPSAIVSPTAANGRPSSAASSTSSSKRPQTPPTPTTAHKITELPGGSVRSKVSSGPSPLRSAIPPQPDSPLAHASVRRRNQMPSPTASPSPSRFMSPGAVSSLISTPGPIILSADSSMDSIDANDVELMLTGADSTAPTPMLPRFRTTRASPDEQLLQTPPRAAAHLPSRANMSYLSPAPPGSEGSPFLRPRPRQSGGERGSILSWEQLAQHNRSLGQEDVEHMLAEIDAPFRSMTASPAPSTLSDIPESPTLSAMPSPTGYGSISQVLLPDVTPSPAIFNATLKFDQMAAESPVGDGGHVMMLRLQLAAAESAANEQRLRIEALEAQLLSAKEARLRDTEDLARHVTLLEEQVQGKLRPDEQLQQYTASLEEQLASAHVLREKAVCEALQQAQNDSVKAQEELLRTHRSRWMLDSLAGGAGTAWSGVKTAAESELEYVRSSREMLAVLLTGLNHTCQRL